MNVGVGMGLAIDVNVSQGNGVVHAAHKVGSLMVLLMLLWNHLDNLLVDLVLASPHRAA